MKLMKLTRSMTPALSTWSPFYRLPAVADIFDALSDGNSSAWWSPSLDLAEDADKFTVSAEIPGMKREDLGISLQDGVLRISGEKKSESDDASTHRRERFYGKFERLIQIPSEVDASKVGAAYRDGVLTVTLPKAEAAKPKKIDVSVE